jgi:hypothetical protein
MGRAARAKAKVKPLRVPVNAVAQLGRAAAQHARLQVAHVLIHHGVLLAHQLQIRQDGAAAGGGG